MHKTIRKISASIITLLLVFVLSSFTAFAQDGENTVTAPELKVSSHTTSTVHLAWTDNENASVSGYEILFYSTAENEYTHIADTAADATSYTVEKLNAGDVYYFAVRGFLEDYENGERIYGDYSNIVQTAATPLAPKITAITRGETTLTISFSNPNCSYYQLRYSTNSDMSNAKCLLVKKSSSKVTISSLASGRKYYVQIRSIVSFPNSAPHVYSAWGTKSSRATMPKKMDLSSVSTPSTTSVKASWKTTTCTGYQLQYSTKSDFSTRYTYTLSKSTTSKTISKLKTGTTYYVRIRAYVTYDGVKVYGAWSDAKKQKVYTSKKLTVAAKQMKSSGWASSTLASVKKGASVRYISTTGRWLKVIYNGKTGYIYNLAFKKSGSSNLSRSKVTAKNYQTYLDDLIFSIGKDKKKLFDYVVSHMSYSYSKLSDAQRKANINSLEKVKKNEGELAAVAIKNRGGICYNFAAFTKTLLQRAGYDVQYIFGSNKNGTHCWVLIHTSDGYRHLDAVRNAYQFTDSQMKSSSKTKDFKWDKSKYPACK